MTVGNNTKQDASLRDTLRIKLTR